MAFDLTAGKAIMDWLTGSKDKKKKPTTARTVNTGGVPTVKDSTPHYTYQSGTANGTSTWRANDGKTITNATTQLPTGEFVNAPKREHTPYQHSTADGSGTWRENTGQVITNKTTQQKDGSFKNEILNQFLYDNPDFLVKLAEGKTPVVKPTATQVSPGMSMTAKDMGSIESSYNAALGKALAEEAVPTGSANPNKYWEAAMNGKSFYNAPANIAQRPVMMGGADMAKHLGVIYNEQDMLNRLDAATKAKYANLDKDYVRMSDDFYDNMGKQADLLGMSMRRGDRDAMRAGASIGAQGANQLSALLGVSEQGTERATELSRERGDLVGKQRSEEAMNASNALKMYNDLGVQLGQVGTSKLNAEMTGYAGELARDTGMATGAMNADAMVRAGLFGASGQLDGAQVNANAQIKSAEINAIAQKYGVDKQTAAQIYAANSNLQASNNAAQLNYEAAKLNSPTNLLRNPDYMKLMQMMYSK